MLSTHSNTASTFQGQRITPVQDRVLRLSASHCLRAAVDDRPDAQYVVACCLRVGRGQGSPVSVGSAPTPGGREDEVLPLGDDGPREGSGRSDQGRGQGESPDESIGAPGKTTCAVESSPESLGEG